MEKYYHFYSLRIVFSRLISTLQNSEIVGFVFDSLLHFPSHINKNVEIGTSFRWGMNKENILETYKKTPFDYAVPIGI